MIEADLSQRAVLVTGAASGIGFATAGLFARMGADVALNDLPGEALDAAVAAVVRAGGTAVAVAGSVGDADEAQAVVESACNRFGRLDYLVNNAGTAGTDSPVAPAELERIGDEMWSDILTINLVGPFRVTRAAVRELRAASGAVVNVASTAAYGYPGSSVAYAASKAGLVNLTTNLARALAPEVRVNAVAPGLIRTPWTARFGRGWEAQSVGRTMLARAGDPEEVAEAILFLCAGGAYITGQTLRVDGGMS